MEYIVREFLLSGRTSAMNTEGPMFNPCLKNTFCPFVLLKQILSKNEKYATMTSKSGNHLCNSIFSVLVSVKFV